MYYRKGSEILRYTSTIDYVVLQAIKSQQHFYLFVPQRRKR